MITLTQKQDTAVLTVNENAINLTAADNAIVTAAWLKLENAEDDTTVALRIKGVMLIVPAKLVADLRSALNVFLENLSWDTETCFSSSC